MTRTPQVSVLVPAYNAHVTIVEAVTSALEQTVREIEVIVADDGSAVPIAETLALIDDQRLQVIRRERNRGVSAARNDALRVARAPLVAQLDADDYWRVDHLEHLLPAFADPDVGLVYANAEIVGFTPSDRWIAPRAPKDGLPRWISDRAIHPVNDLRLLYRVNPIPAPAVAMRTAAVLAVGGYPEWLSVGEEYLVYLRLRRAGWRFAYVDRCSATYRWPEPGRGATLNARRNSREETKLFTVLALSSRPNRAIFARLGVELIDLVKAYAPATIALGRRLRVVARCLRRQPTQS